MRGVPAVLALVVAAASAAVTAAAENHYVGAKACAVCHTTGKGGNASAVWEQSAHARAYQTLKASDEKSKDGLNAWESPGCLRCHVTGGGEATSAVEGLDRTEGVSCEACHGAASAFLATHAKGDRVQSKQAGLNPVDPAQVCNNCHNKGCGRDFTFAEKWPKIKHQLSPAE